MKKTSILIVGADGRIGSYLYENLSSDEFIVYGTSRHARYCDNSAMYLFDLNDKVYSFARESFDLAIICAGITDINYCENNPQIAKEINVNSTIRLIDHLSKSGSKVLFMSSSAVFDGSHQFVEHAFQTNPTTVYGKTKVELENYLLNNLTEFAILRLTKVIEPNAGFITRWESLLLKGCKIPIYVNHFLSPINCDQVLDAVLRIINGRNFGIYQLGGMTEISYFDYAQYHFEESEVALDLLEPETDKRVIKKFNSLRTFLPSDSK